MRSWVPEEETRREDQFHRSGEGSHVGFQEPSLALCSTDAWNSSDGGVSEEDNSSDESGGPQDEDGLQANERNH